MTLFIFLLRHTSRLDSCGVDGTQEARPSYLCEAVRDWDLSITCSQCPQDSVQWTANGSQLTGQNANTLVLLAGNYFAGCYICDCSEYPESDMAFSVTLAEASESVHGL